MIAPETVPAQEAQSDWITASELFTLAQVSRHSGYKALQKLKENGYDVYSRYRLPNRKNRFYNPKWADLVHEWALTH